MFDFWNDLCFEIKFITVFWPSCFLYTQFVCWCICSSEFKGCVIYSLSWSRTFFERLNELLWVGESFVVFNFCLSFFNRAKCYLLWSFHDTQWITNLLNCYGSLSFSHETFKYPNRRAEVLPLYKRIYAAKKMKPWTILILMVLKLVGINISYESRASA